MSSAAFSQRQADAGRAMAAAVPQALTGEEALAAYFEERAAYLADHPVEVTEGTGALLRRLRAAGLDVVCYGGWPSPTSTSISGRMPGCSPLPPTLHQRRAPRTA